MKKITSFTIHSTAEGERASFVYAVVDDEGNIVMQNKRAETILVDENALKNAQDLYDFLETKIPE